MVASGRWTFQGKNSKYQPLGKVKLFRATRVLEKQRCELVGWIPTNEGWNKGRPEGWVKDKSHRALQLEAGGSSCSG